MLFNLMQNIRKRRWLKHHSNWDNTRQKRKALQKYLDSFKKE